MTRAAIYARISKDDEGLALGIQRQAEDCRALIAHRGWEAVEPVYDDNDITGSGKKIRPAWERLMDDIRGGRVDVVCAYSSSRLYRNLRDLGNLEILTLADEGRVSIETVASGLVDLTTADGRMQARIQATVDQHQWEKTSELVIRKKRQLRAQGLWTGGRRPFGFDPVPEVGGTRLVANATEARLIRSAASDVLNGVSLASIARRWNMQGVTTTGGQRWGTTHVRVVLSAERMAPEILAPTDHDRLRELFGGRSVGTAGDRYLLTGLLRCGLCSAQMSGRGGYYICKNPGGGGDVHPKGKSWTNPKTGKVVDLSGRPKGVHLGAKRGAVDATVREAAAERPDPEVEIVHDPGEPLTQQREETVQKMIALGDSDLPDAVIRGRARKLQRELDEIDRQLDATRPRGRFAQLLAEAEEFDERSWIEGLVEEIVLWPAKRGAARFDPERLTITWRS